MSFCNVLVYADGRPESAVALAEALRLVQGADGRATVMDVVHYLPTRIPRGLFTMQQAELLGLMLEQRREQLEEEVEPHRSSGSLDVRVAHGSPAFELVRQAVRNKHDLIVKAARGRDVKRMTSFGSTALHLVRKSPVPVMLLSPNRQLLEAPKVLVAVDFDDPEQRPLNRALLRAGATLASTYTAELHVVHVHDTRRSSVYRSFLSSELFERFCRERQELVGQELAALVGAELGAFPYVHAHLLDGDPADALVDFVQARRVSHLVMGSVARQTQGLMLGSLAEEVLTRVDCSVVTLKPAGFVSPIEIEVHPAA